MQIVKIPLTDVILDPSNARKHSPKNLDSIKGSLKRWGQQKPIVIDKKNVVIAGNGTVMAAKDLGWKHIHAYQTELEGYEAMAFAIADNRTAELAEWETSVLDESLAKLALNDIDLDFLSFEKPDISVPGLVGDDDVPDTEENKYGVKLGDIWQLGEHRVMCGDSTSKEAVEKLMNGEKAGMVFTDPPYGVNYDGGIQFTNEGVKKGQRKKIENDHSEDIYSKSIPVMASNCDGPIYTWYAASHEKQLYNAIDDVGQYHAMIVWVKNGGYGALNASYKQKHEPCVFWKPKGKTLKWCGATTENTIWEINKDGVNKLHPTQKPVALAEKAIKNHDAISVLDLFLGSGSTLIACEKTSRKCYGMEIDPHYCSVIIERWENFTGKKAIILASKNSDTI